MVEPTSSQTEGFDFPQLVELLETTHQQSQVEANRSINRALVIRNWLFGWYIVEFQQHGTDRAEYGKETLKQLSTELKQRIGRGFSVQNLEMFRRFYLSSPTEIGLSKKSQTLSGKSVD